MSSVARCATDPGGHPATLSLRELLIDLADTETVIRRRPRRTNHGQPTDPVLGYALGRQQVLLAELTHRRARRSSRPISTQAARP